MLKVANWNCSDRVQKLVVLVKEFCIRFGANEVNCACWYKRAQSGIKIQGDTGLVKEFLQEVTFFLSTLDSQYISGYFILIMAASDSGFVNFKIQRCNAQGAAVGHRFGLLRFNRWVKFASEGWINNHILQDAEKEQFQVCAICQLWVQLGKITHSCRLCDA